MMNIGQRCRKTVTHAYNPPSKTTRSLTFLACVAARRFCQLPCELAADLLATQHKEAVFDDVTAQFQDHSLPARDRQLHALWWGRIDIPFEQT